MKRNSNNRLISTFCKVILFLKDFPDTWMMDIKYGIHGKYKTDKGIELQSTFYIGFWLGHVRQVYDVRIYPRKKANNIRYIDDIEEW